MKQKIRILIADDHGVVRRGLVLVLRQESDFEVVGEAKDGVAAVRMTEELMPDLVVLDWKMPGMDGLQAAYYIRAKMPTVRLLLLSGARIGSAGLDALDDGIDGFVLKDIAPDELTHAIRVVAAGHSYLCPQVTKALIEYSKRSRELARRRGLVKLTPREEEILGFLIKPLTYRQIGKVLSISEETVRRHVKNVLVKLNQPNRMQAVIEALKLGLISLEDHDDKE
ncbi:MAG: response regulator [Ardenticatenaceae bacterium]